VLGLVGGAPRGASPIRRRAGVFFFASVSQATSSAKAREPATAHGCSNKARWTLTPAADQFSLWPERCATHGHTYATLAPRSH